MVPAVIRSWEIDLPTDLEKCTGCQDLDEKKQQMNRKQVWRHPFSHPSTLPVTLFVLVFRSFLTLWSRGLYPARLLCPWNFPGKNTGVGSQSLLQAIFPTQGLKLDHLNCRQILYHLNHQGSPVCFKISNLYSNMNNTTILWSHKCFWILCHPRLCSICNPKGHRAIFTVFQKKLRECSTINF